MFRCSRSIPALAFASLALVSARVAAQQPAPPKPLMMTAQNLTADNDRRAINRGDAPAAMAGDVIRYQLTFTNVRTDSVRNVQFTDPLPAGLHYLAGSAHADRADVTVDFSIDGGRTYAEQPMVDVMIDGRTVRQPAPAAAYTNVRWTVRGWVPARGHVTAEFTSLLGDGVAKP